MWVKELSPHLTIKRNPSERNAKYILHQSDRAKFYNSKEGPWQNEYQRVRRLNALSSLSIIQKLFVDSSINRPLENNDKYIDLIYQLYNIALGLQNMDLGAEEIPSDLDYLYGNPLLTLFNSQQLFHLWMTYNWRNYTHYGNHILSNGCMLESALPLLENIISSADAALEGNSVCANLRFGHDINIIPLVGLLGINGGYGPEGDVNKIPFIFQDYNISPMAANVQFIFYRNQKNDVLIKVLLNERESSLPLNSQSFPFYKWSDFKAYAQELKSRFTEPKAL